MRLRILHKCERSNDTWTVRKLEDMYYRKELTFENAVQRGYVWDNERQSRMIMSILLDKPIPLIHVARYDDSGIYSAIDGKQRSMTLIKFMNDEFEINGLDVFELEDENGNVVIEDLNGKKFSEISDTMQNAIKDATLSIDIVHNPTDDQVCEIFYDLNNGKAPSAMIKARTRAKSKKEITALGANKLFTSALTEKAFQTYANEDLVVKAWSILFQDEPCLDSKVITPLIRNVAITKEEQDTLNQCFNRVYDAYKLIEDKRVAKRILARVHMISIMKVANESIQDGLTTRQFMEWLVTFFVFKKRATISNIYNDAARDGTGHKENVKKRLTELDKSYHEFCASSQRVA